MFWGVAVGEPLPPPRFSSWTRLLAARVFSGVAVQHAGGKEPPCPEEFLHRLAGDPELGPGAEHPALRPAGGVESKGGVSWGRRQGRVVFLLQQFCVFCGFLDVMCPFFECEGFCV